MSGTDGFRLGSWLSGPESERPVDDSTYPGKALGLPETGSRSLARMGRRILALLSRQFDTAQSDLRDAQLSLDRYFDRGARRVLAAGELLRTVGGQARLVNVPRPDATLAAIATASAGR